MRKALAFLLPVLLLISCTYTVTKIKEPEFAGPVDSLQAGLNALVACQHFHLDGKEVTTNGVPLSQLEIDVINGKDIPETDSAMKTLAHSIASEVKKFLKDKKAYDTYPVLFVKLQESSTETKRSWKGWTFKSAEL